MINYLVINGRIRPTDKANINVYKGYLFNTFKYIYTMIKKSIHITATLIRLYLVKYSIYNLIIGQYCPTKHLKKQK